MTDATPDPKLTVEQRTNGVLRLLALAAHGLWSLSADPEVHETWRSHHRLAAVRVADVLVGLFPDDAIQDAGQLARDSMEVRGKEPTTDEVLSVYMAVVGYLVPLAEPPMPGGGEDA